MFGMVLSEHRDHGRDAVEAAGDFALERGLVAGAEFPASMSSPRALTREASRAASPEKMSCTAPPAEANVLSLGPVNFAPLKMLAMSDVRRFEEWADGNDRCRLHARRLPSEQAV